MPLIKRGNTWHVHFFTPDGKRIRQSTGTVDKKEAQEFHDRLKASIWRTEQLGDKPDRTWQEAVIKYLEETDYKASRDKDLQMLKWLNRFFRDKLLSDITRSEIQRVAQIKCDEKLVGRKRVGGIKGKLVKGKIKKTEKATVNRYLALIRAILNKAEQEWEWIDKAPKLKFPRFSVLQAYRKTPF